LSERRAAAVRTQLISGGVAEARISSKGFGKTQPVASNDTPSGRQQNRRVEVIVLGAGKVADALKNNGSTPTP
jgi:outer membrane protein OmpA-like peptidoglycan-associated protein